jgi:hypothetical protein
MVATFQEDSAHGGHAATDAIASVKSTVNGSTNGSTADNLVLVKDFTKISLPASKIPGTQLVDILPEDQKTGDDWVPRHSKMIRLTGRHPFNSEPPPADLMASYFTSPELHYVRNHAKVPKVRMISVSRTT